MNFLLFCFSLIAMLKWSFSDVQLVSSGPGSVIPGQNLNLVCKVTGFSITTHYYYWHWVRQPPGKGLEWIARIYPYDGSKHYSSSLQSRTTIDSDNSKNEFSLQLNSMSTSDTAVYYCARGTFEYWGKGTSVVVTSVPAKAPTVFPLSSKETITASDVTIACLVKDFFPETATVQWNSGAITSGIYNFPPVRHASGEYTQASLLTISSNQWESELFQCNVEHEATNTRINTNVEKCDVREPVAPELQLLHSSCNPKGSDGTISLHCFINSFYPKDIEVEWLVGSHSGLLTPYTEPPKRDANKYTFSTNSVVNITQADWMEGNAYYCQVTHAASQTRTKSRAKKCEDSISQFCTDVSAYLLPPRPKDLYINRNAKISCTVNNLQQEEELKITWSREKQVAAHPGLVVVTEENNGTFTAVSQIPISAQDWESGETFTCSVEYPGLPGPIVKTITKSREKSIAPRVHIYPPIPSNSLVITCILTDFSPSEVDVQWLKNGNAISEKDFVNTPVMKEKSGNSNFMYSKLTFPKASWEEGDNVSCMVVHEALEMKFTQRSIEKNMGKR